MTTVPHMTEARALNEARGYRAALTRKVNAWAPTAEIKRAEMRLWAAEQRLDAIRSQQPERRIGAAA